MAEQGDAATPTPADGPTHAADPLLGRVLGRYRLLRKLGAGGMGLVYEARDSNLDRAVAVKVLPAATAADRDLRERFVREARAAARITHPHVVPVFEVGHAEGVDYLAMELVPGGSAQDVLQRHGPLPWREATRILAAVCSGLAAAHAAGLVHRDVKPANILLAQAEPGAALNRAVPKLSDFGLAKVRDLSSLTSTGHVVGTPYFMSPEQCRAQPVDGRSDVYALGATYFTLLTGRYPFPGGDDPLTVLFAHCEQPVPDLTQLRPDLPPGCAAIIQRAMAKSPSERYPTAAALQQDLEALLAGQTPTAPAPTPASVATEAPTQRLDLAPRRRRPRTLYLVVGAVVLLSLLIDLALWWRGRGEGNSPAALGPGAALRSGGAVADLAFSADGRWLAAANLDGAKGVCLWERATGKKSHLWPGDGVHALAFAPDGRALALGGTGSGELRWCPLPPGEPGNASTVDAKVRALAFAGPMLIGGLEPWKQASRHYLQTWDAATSKPLANPSGLTGNVWSVSVHPGKNLLATGDESGRIQVWSLDGFKRGPQRQTDRHGYSPSVAFVPDGTGLLVGANEADGCHLYLLDPADLAKARWPQPTGITGQIYRLAVDPKGRWAAVAGGQGVVLVSLADGRARPPLDGLPGPATAVAFAPDGALVAGGSKDGAVRLWPVPNP